MIAKGVYVCVLFVYNTSPQNLILPPVKKILEKLSQTVSQRSLLLFSNSIFQLLLMVGTEFVK